ncbi:MAG: AraC family transcriptional regulator [Verrucomicrobiae bacterium]|nr:AraC family transcriptional regulator [Verrucomicrobiae bacterium]
MFLESVITPLSRLGKGQGEPSSECTFWTGRDGQLCVQYFRPGADVCYQPHSHSEYTVTVCLAGEVRVRQLGQAQIIGPGEALMGNYGVEHSSGYRSQNGQPCEAVSIAFDPRLLSALAANLKLPAFTGETCPAFIGKVNSPVFEDCARGMIEEFKGGTLGHKIIIEIQTMRLLVETIRSWPRDGVGVVATDTSPRLPRREFVRAYEFMRWCRKEDFRLRHLCRFLGSSEERFTRLFLASTRQTPASFYNRMLLEQARDRLRNSKLSVKEVGFELGFRTSSHFNAAFRREFGHSPQECRLRDFGSRGGGHPGSAIPQSPARLMNEAVSAIPQLFKHMTLQPA